jgi:dihydropteroate synthase
MPAPRRVLRARDRTLELGERPLLMGIVNASPDSFSDRHDGLEAQVEHARRLLADGADLLDVGGESAVTNVPPVEPAEEIGRVVPLVERLASELGALVSVDTYKIEVAEAAIAAGAAIVNDVSGLRDERLADVCAKTGAALVVMHTAAAPKQRRQDAALYGDVFAEVAAFLRERMDVALSRGVADEQLIVDPGPDFAKTPAQTIALLRRLGELEELGRPVLLAASRKDFVGAITTRRPREREAGTLAALGFGVDAGVHLLRVHDVRGAADYLAVRAVLRGERDVPDDLALTDEIRLER